MPKCPECNASYGTDDEFCSKCGERLTQKKEKEVDISKEVTKGIIHKELKDTKSKFLFIGLIIVSIGIGKEISETVGIITFIVGIIFMCKWYYG